MLLETRVKHRFLLLDVRLNSSLQLVQRVQNTLARIVLQKPFSASATELPT